MSQTTLREVPALVAARKPFRGNSISGVTCPLGFTTFGSGRLSGADLEHFRSDHRAASLRYVVLSYDTPIAWVLEDGTTYRVAQKFSVTTSRHMGCLYTL